MWGASSEEISLRSATTRRFWQLFQALPADVQHLATKNYRLWLRNPGHPSLHFRQLRGTDDLWSVRIGKGYRAIGQVEAGNITWTWIGSHAEYNRLTKHINP
jgi:hypothetical protein